MVTPATERYEVDAKTGCWVWQSTVMPDGYGRFHGGGQRRTAHRVVYELLVGPIPEGMQLDHLCRNKLCVNPDHLEPVTNAENQRRGDAARMSWEAVRFVRENYVPRDPEFGMRALARRFCVTHGAIHKIVHGSAWVDDPALVGGK